MNRSDSRSPFSMTNRSIFFAALLIGCTSTLSQVLLFRELMVLVGGNELTLSTLLAGWLAGIAAGALIPKRLNLENRLPFYFSSAFVLLPALILGSILLIRFAPYLLHWPAEENPSPLMIVFLSILSVLPVSLLIGFSFPVLSLSSGSPNRTSSNATAIGSIFMTEALGSALGGVLLAAGIIPRRPPLDIAWFLLVTASVFLLVQSKRPRTVSQWALWTLCILFGFWAGIPQHMEHWSAEARWQTQHPGYERIRARETPYQRLELGMRDEQYTIFGDGSALVSFPDDYGNSQWAAMSLSQQPAPHTILLIGHGGIELFPFYLRNHPERFWILEKDAAMDQLRNPATASFMMQPQPRTIHQDAVRFFTAQENQNPFDLIAIREGDPNNGITNRYYTREFFQTLQPALSPEGVLVFTTTGTPNNEWGDSGFYCGTLYWTLRDVFKQVLAIPGSTWWFFASNQKTLLSDPQKVIDQYNQAVPAQGDFDPELFRLYYEKERIDDTQQAFNAYESYPRNHDVRPLCYLYNLLLWSKEYGYLKNVPLPWLACTGWRLAGVCLGFTLGIFAAGWIVPALFLFRRNPEGKTPLRTLALSGAASMAAEIAILLYFQSKAGYLYQHIGIFFGVFMLGLAMGSALSNYKLRISDSFSMRWLWTVDASFILSLLLTPAVLRSLISWNPSVVWIETIFALWLSTLSLLMGSLLPLAARAVENHSSSLGSLAGWVDAADCAGGALGALITGGLMIPLVGFENVFYIFAGAKLIHLALAAFQPGSNR